MHTVLGSRLCRLNNAILACRAILSLSLYVNHLISQHSGLDTLRMHVCVDSVNNANDLNEACLVVFISISD